MKPPAPAEHALQQLRDNSLQQLAKLAFLTLILAWCLTLTSTSLLLNLPLAVVSVLSVLWLLANLQPEQPKPPRRQRNAEPDAAAASPPARLPSEPGAGLKAGKWREQIGSRVVEGAWETLCGSILQEFVYDMWYAALTPDREFPRELRRVLNTAFGELAARARKSDLRGMLLRDVSELVIDQIELFRVTRDSIVAGLDPGAWAAMPQAARDRALLAELKAEGHLHPALQPHDAAATRGHYQVIHAISEGLVAFLMERSDHGKAMMRSVARELLATCVLRQLVVQFTPYNTNKLILALLQTRHERKPMDVEEAAAAAEVKFSQPDAAKGSWDFTERARHSLQQEERAAPRSRPSKRAPKPAAAPAAAPRAPPPEAPAACPSAAAQQPQPQQQPTAAGEASGSSEQPAAAAAAAQPAAAAPAPEQPRSVASAVAPASVPASVLGPASGAERQQSAERQAGDSRSGSGALDAGNVMGLPAAAARWRSRGGFIGRPRARVVAAELNSEGSKDVVMYKIRVADGTGEWTVSRRFRNFEALHRTLKGLPAYRLRMPAKRVFSHSQTVEFVEERRQQLDAFLQAMLADGALAGRQEVWDFLSAWSEVYGLDCDESLLGTINASLRDVNVNMRRAVGDIVEDLDAKRRKALPTLAKLASAPGQEGAGGRQGGQSLLGRGLPSLGSWDSLQTRAQTRSPSPAPPGARRLGGAELNALATSVFSSARSKADSARSEGDQEEWQTREQVREEFQGQVLHYTYVPPGSDRGTPPRTSPSNSVLLERPPEPAAAAPRAEPNAGVRLPDGACSDAAPRGSDEREAADASRGRPPGAGGGGAPKRTAEETRPGDETAGGSLLAPAADSGHIKLTAALPLSPQQATEKLAAVPPAVVPSSLAAAAVEERGELAGLELEEAAGVSAPLYDVVDVLFQLQGRGFFRRQVFVVARQMLSLVAGGAIDEYILSQLRALRQEHQLARLIHTLQVALWPGGVWFQRLPERQPPPGAPPPPRYIMTPENYLSPGGPEPLDAEEIREAVRALLLSSAPPALIRVIGRDSYEAGMRDLFDMLQSLTFMQQLGYGLLRTLLVGLLPELKPLFRAIERADTGRQGK